MSESDSQAVQSLFYVESDFCSVAESLRAHFERIVSGSTNGEGGLTPMTYAFRQDCFQFLTASSEHVFTQELLENVVANLRAWAENALRASHISTPQVRVYIDGCWRGLFRDVVGTKWHYVLWLSRKRHRKVARLKMVTEELPVNGAGQPISVGRFLSFPSKFNQLLVHHASLPYAIEEVRASMNPAEAAVFLDGYMW